MKNKNNTKRIKLKKEHTEDQIELAHFIRILIIIIILVLGVYFLTRIFVTKDLFNKENENEVTKGEINYNTTLIGNMLKQPEDKYYVIIYDTEDIDAVYYSGLISNYNKNEDAIKVYLADLNNGLNQKYVTTNDDDVNVDTMDFEDFKVKKLALIKVEDGKIRKALIDEEEIAKELEYQK